MVGEAGVEPTTPGLEDAPLRFSVIYPRLPSGHSKALKIRVPSVSTGNSFTANYCGF
jgi:hypothetical protein